MTGREEWALKQELLFEKSPAYVVPGKSVAVLRMSSEGTPEIVEKYGDESFEASIAHEIGHLLKENEYVSALDTGPQGSLNEFARTISGKAGIAPKDCINLTEFFCDVLSEHLTGKMVPLRRKIYADRFEEGNVDYLLSHLPAYSLSERASFGDYSALASGRSDNLPDSLFWEKNALAEYCLNTPMTGYSMRALSGRKGYYSQSKRDREWRMCGVP